MFYVLGYILLVFFLFIVEVLGQKNKSQVPQLCYFFKCNYVYLHEVKLSKGENVPELCHVIQMVSNGYLGHWALSLVRKGCDLCSAMLTLLDLLRHCSV